MKKDLKELNVMTMDTANAVVMLLAINAILVLITFTDFLSAMVFNTTLKTAKQSQTYCLSLDCRCNEQGSVDKNCDATSGKCTCKDDTFAGDKCDQCAENHFGFPDCKGK